MNRPRSQGNQFIGGPFLTFSAFSTMAFLDRWARGLGGQWIDYVDRYFERVKNQGADGVRVFGETTFWDDRDDNTGNNHRFFNKFRATSDRIWDFNQLANGSRPTRLTLHNAQIIMKLIELCHKHDLFAEYVTDATMKHGIYGGRQIGWNVIGHTIRQTADFFRRLERGETPEWMGTAPPHIQAQWERLANREVPFLHEGHNEWGAHSFRSWQRDGLEREGALLEVNRQMERHHRDEQWPEGLFSISDGGTDSPEQDFSTAGYVTIHAERQGEWWRVGDRFRSMERYGKPIYINEMKHYISPARWDQTVGAGWFSPNSSTQDAGAVLDFVESSFDRGYSVCIHSLVGMSDGVWENEEEMVLTPLERELLVSEPPPPPPIPEEIVLDPDIWELVARKK